MMMDSQLSARELYRLCCDKLDALAKLHYFDYELREHFSSGWLLNPRTGTEVYLSCAISEPQRTMTIRIPANKDASNAETMFSEPTEYSVVGRHAPLLRAYSKRVVTALQDALPMPPTRSMMGIRVPRSEEIVAFLYSFERNFSGLGQCLYVREGRKLDIELLPSGLVHPGAWRRLIEAGRICRCDEAIANSRHPVLFMGGSASYLYIQDGWTGVDGSAYYPFVADKSGFSKARRLQMGDDIRPKYRRLINKS